MKKICICVSITLSLSLGATIALAQSAPIPPLKYNLPVVSPKDETPFSELDRRAKRYDDKQVLRIDENVAIGQIRPPRDLDRTDRYRNKGGFGFKGLWHF